MYRTGDLAMYLPNGEIKCLGRADYQVKISGYRIELGEIESILESHPNVVQCIADVTKTEPKQLIAYIVATENQIVSDAELQGVVSQNCPHYMVPSLFVHLQSIPHLPNGKVNRNALPLPEMADASLLMSERIEPNTELEQKLTKICEELLEGKSIGVTTSFFLMGGDSLFAMKLKHVISEKFGVEILMTTLLTTANTVRTLAQLISSSSNQKPSEKDTASPVIVPFSTTGNRPPLFFVHPAGGFVFMYSLLSSHLGTQQPFYAIQDPFLIMSQESPKSIELIAEYYLESILEINPKGPFFFGRMVNGRSHRLSARHIAETEEKRGPYRLHRRSTSKNEISQNELLDRQYLEGLAHDEAEHHPKIQKVQTREKYLKRDLRDSGQDHGRK